MNVFITGSSEGLGFSLAEKFLENGHDVFICSSNENKLTKAYSKLHLKCNDNKLFYSRCDISKKKDVINLVKKINTVFNFKIDVIINNAAQIGPVGFFTARNTSEIINLFHINFFSVCNIIKLLIPCLNKKNITSIINIGGSNSFKPDPKFSAYASSKGALMSLTLALASELEGQNININYILPGSINTPMNDKKLKIGHEILGDDLYEHFQNRKLQDSYDSITNAVNFIYQLSIINKKINGRILSAQYDDITLIYNKIKVNKNCYTLSREAS